MNVIDKRKWMFVDTSSVDLSKLSKEELLSFRAFIKARINKHAAHCIRLLKMSIEFLIDGEMQVERKDASYLLDIKRGEWTIGQVQEEAERLFAQAENAFIQSTLPVRPDFREVDKLMVKIADVWRNSD